MSEQNKDSERARVVDAMCMTWRHDFGLERKEDELGSCGMTDGERDALRRQMGQLYDHHLAAPSLPAAGSAELTAVRCQCCATEYPHDSYDAGFIAGSGMCQVCDAAIPAVHLPSAAPAEQPYPHGIAEDLERSDWAPLEALQWYAAGKHFDVADGRTRIIDTGAVASNALKHASLAYLELKGDAELSELRAALSAQKSAHVSVPECKLGIRGRAYDAPSVCRAYTYTEQPNNDHACKLGKSASAVKAGGDYIDAGLSLLEQLQANGFGVFELRALLNGGEA